MPWWEFELPLIRKKLDEYLSRRLRAWAEDREDLVSETLLSLTREIRGHPSAFPRSWFKPTTPSEESERSHLHKLAMVVLKRRIADLFRKRAPSLNLLGFGEQRHAPVASEASTPERKVLLARMLEITITALSRMPIDDRDLIGFTVGERGVRKALNARERQRLHRLRLKLRHEIARHLGEEAADLLRRAF
jgi:hypothetical protein